MGLVAGLMDELHWAGTAPRSAKWCRMASSRASTPAARKRQQAKATRVRGHASSSPAAKPKPKPKSPPKAKPRPKSKAQKPKAPAKPRVTAKPKAARPKSAPSRPQALLSRTLTIASIVAALSLCLAATYFFWFRDSSFVAVEKVTVEGIEGPEAKAVTAALTAAGAEMTTLNVDEGELAAAVSGYPTVVSVNAEADLPHGLTVEVESRPPVVSLTDGGPPVAAAADGTLLRGVEAAPGTVPTVEVDDLPATGRLTGDSLALAVIAGAAPAPLRPLIDDISHAGPGSIEVELKGGIPVDFGEATQAEDKWAAVAAILADPKVKTLTHIDVRVPERPAIGGAAPPPKGQ